MNVFLSRNDEIKYENSGRWHNEQEARDVDQKMLDIFSKYNLDIHNIKVKKITGDLANSHITDILNIL